MNDPFAEAAKRSLIQQQSQNALLDQLMATFPGVPCAQTVTGHGQGQDPQGHIIGMVKLMLMTPAGPILLALEPEFAIRLANDLNTHAIQAKSGIEIVQNGK